ncbi:MAG: hypothetical protein JF602_01495, partial [Gemmatimonadetes bacterium]|nr:hypothetical protein [Gemmatimonadota bacterium]
MQRRSLLSFTIALALGCRAPATMSGSTSSPATQSAPTTRYEIAYRIAMPDPASHLFDVRIDIGNITGDELRLQMPVWSPGRYARFDFA